MMGSDSNDNTKDSSSDNVNTSDDDDVNPREDSNTNASNDAPITPSNDTSYPKQHPPAHAQAATVQAQEFQSCRVRDIEAKVRVAKEG